MSMALDNWSTNQTKHYLSALEKTSHTCTIMNSTQHNINFNNRGKKRKFFFNYLCIFFSWLWSQLTSSETFFCPSIAFTKSASAFWSLFFNSGTSSCNDWISLWRKREVYEHRQEVPEVKLLKKHSDFWIPLHDWENTNKKKSTKINHECKKNGGLDLFLRLLTKAISSTKNNNLYVL